MPLHSQPLVSEDIHITITIPLGDDSSTYTFAKSQFTNGLKALGVSEDKVKLVFDTLLQNIISGPVKKYFIQTLLEATDFREAVNPQINNVADINDLSLGSTDWDNNLQEAVNPQVNNTGDINYSPIDTDVNASIPPLKFINIDQNNIQQGRFQFCDDTETARKSVEKRFKPSNSE